MCEFQRVSDRELVETAKALALEWRRRFARLLPITEELGELLACQQLGLERMPPGNRGFDARDAQGTYQIKARAPQRTRRVVTQGRVGRFQNYDFDYALLVLLDDQLELHEIWKASVKAVEHAQIQELNPKHGIGVSKFKNLDAREKVYPKPSSAGTGTSGGA